MAKKEISDREKRIRHLKFKDIVIELGAMGVSDTEIAKKLNVGRAFVQKTTTKYWVDKMKKNEKNE
jgi:hypothetical protein